VPPSIAYPSELDADRNKIDDTIDARLRDVKSALAIEHDPSARQALQTALSEPVRVELLFSRQITQKQIDDFAAAGGEIEYIYQAVSYGWNASLPIETVETLPGLLGDSLVAVIADRPAQLHLDEATQTGRVRPVWASGFAGNPSGFSGSPTTTIGILDTGIDDSHTDLSGRQEYWKDWTTDNEMSPRDIIQHGSHVTGIACGTGASAGSAAGTLYYTDSGDMSGLAGGYFYPTPIHILTGSSVTFTSTATWIGGGSTDLYQVYNTNGSTGGYTAVSASTFGSSPVTESNTFTPSSSRLYSAALVQGTPSKVAQFAIENSVTNYPGVGDGFNKLSGVAPGCKWAGGKVFKNDGTGSGLDIQEAVDDMVVQRVTHNIKVANMSLGIIGNPGIDTVLRSKVNTMVNNGIVAVISAGNDGPGTAGSNQVDDPGRAALAITVAASNDVNQLTRYTSSGFSLPGSDEDYKPDVMAPGGSDYYSLILSVDSNDADAEIVSFADRRANDYYNIKGTSMASPFVAGSAALVIQALESAGLTWSFSSSAHPLLVKMLLCATSTESNAPREVSSGTNPSLGRATSPKDLYEGYGLINPDAAVEAATLAYSGGTVNASTAGGYYDRRAWARKLRLASGTKVNVSLDVPSTGDFDLYLYSGTPESKGNPVIRAYSTSAGLNTDESINFTSGVAETAYLVIKRVSGSGSWILTGNVGPTVTVNQAAGQADPTSVSPINFTAVFSSPVYGFVGLDVTIGGTSSGTKTADVTGGPTSFNIAVSGMTSSGTVIASIGAGMASDAYGNPNLASTSTDNTVTYTYNPPTVVISGYVRDSAGNSLADVQMTGLPGSPTPKTDAAGYYSATVTGGWSGTVTPTRSCYSFAPPSRTYSSVASDLLTENYTAVLQPNTISGYVLASDASPIQGADVATSGGVYSAAADQAGWYVLGSVAPGTYDLTASKSGFISRTYASQHMSAGDFLREDFVLGYTTASSPSGAVSTGWSLFSVPLEPVNPDPIAVLPGIRIDGYLYRWDKVTQSQITYDEWAPGVFSDLNTDEGYWLAVDSAYTISYQAYGGTAAMRDISLPASQWSIVGCPFQRNINWEDIRVTLGAVTVPLRNAANDLDKGWLSSTAFWWDSMTQSQLDVGLPEDWPMTTQMQPWHGYWVNSSVDGLVLTLR